MALFVLCASAEARGARHREQRSEHQLPKRAAAGPVIGAGWDGGGAASDAAHQHLQRSGQYLIAFMQKLRQTPNAATLGTPHWHHEGGEPPLARVIRGWGGARDGRGVCLALLSNATHRLVRLSSAKFWEASWSLASLGGSCACFYVSNVFVIIRLLML